MQPLNSLPPIVAAQAATEAAAENGSAIGAKSKPSDSAEHQKLVKAAGDFESILLASMWKSMKQSFGGSDDQDSDPASGTLNDWGIEVMSGAVGKSGGLGIGKLITKYLERSTDGTAGAPEKAAHAGQDPKVLGNLADNTE